MKAWWIGHTPVVQAVATVRNIASAYISARGIVSHGPVGVPTTIPQGALPRTISARIVVLRVT